MRFTSAIAAGALAVAASAQKTTGSDPTQTFAIDPVQSSILACVDTCDPTDIGCLAACNPVPNPNEDQVADTHDCIADCDQGDGTEAQTEIYAQCLAKCVKENYYDADKGTPNSGAGGGSGGDKEADKTTAGTATVTTGALPTKSVGVTETDVQTQTESTGGDATQSGDEADASETGSSDEDENAGNGLFASSAALFGAIAAVLAL
jgi:hypothetical protein